MAYAGFDIYERNLTELQVCVGVWGCVEEAGLR